MLKILTVPNPILTTPVKTVVRIDKKIKKLVEEMERILVSQKDPQGVGLAAPQVGEGRAIFIMKPTEKAKTEVFVNPKIIKTEGEEKPLKRPKTSESAKKGRGKLEGCLSLYGVWSPVKRPHKVLLSWDDVKTQKEKQKWFTGFKAVIIQHEVDHLKGVLFTQRALEQNAPLYEEKEGKLRKIQEI
ncbi:peptide deformylase [Candidatus Roizmanbacteria bacterium]|nr:peptide deformylase [Candidatus Roizmanbacteria bacterium]